MSEDIDDIDDNDDDSIEVTDEEECNIRDCDSDEAKKLFKVELLFSLLSN